MALPTRPASIVAASTGPSSRTSDMLITAPSLVSRFIWRNCVWLCTASTMPMNVPVSATTGRLSTPIW